MPILIASPLLLLVLARQWPPFNALLATIPMPYTLYVSVALVTGLVLLMLQWHWLYVIALACGYYVAMTALPETVMASAVLTSAIIVLLTLIATPTLPSSSGFFLLVSLSITPFLVSLFSVSEWENPITPYIPEQFSTLFVSIKEAFQVPGRESVLYGSFVIQAAVWFLVLYSAPVLNAQHWGQFTCWTIIPMTTLPGNLDVAHEWPIMAFAGVIMLSLTIQMRQLAYIDELTQLPHRRALQRHLKRLNGNSAVTMLDVDHFKKFNDTYGHDVGDQVLRLLGSILRKERGFSAYRYGGEEFTLVFNHKDPEKLRLKLESVRSKVAEYPLVIRTAERPKDNRQAKKLRALGKKNTSQRTKITISLGCAVRKHGESADSLIQRADEALYAAKKAGRNCTVLARGK